MEKDKWRRNELAMKGWHVMPFITSHFRDNTISQQIHPKMRRYFPRRRDETYAGRSEEAVASAGWRTGRPPRGSKVDASASLSTSKEQAEPVPPCGIGWICTANWFTMAATVNMVHEAINR